MLSLLHCTVEVWLHCVLFLLHFWKFVFSFNFYLDFLYNNAFLSIYVIVSFLCFCCWYLDLRYGIQIRCRILLQVLLCFTLGIFLFGFGMFLILSVRIWSYIYWVSFLFLGFSCPLRILVFLSVGCWQYLSYYVNMILFINLF